MAYDPSLRGLGIGDPSDADRRREAREDARAAAAAPPANASYGLILEAEGASSANLAYGVARRVYPAISALDPATPAGLPYQYGSAGGAATLDTPASLERRAPAERAMAPEARRAAQVWIMDTRTGRARPAPKQSAPKQPAPATATAAAPLVALIAQGGAAASPIAEQLTRAESSMNPLSPAPPAPASPPASPPASTAATSAGLPRWVLPVAAAGVAYFLLRRR